MFGHVARLPDNIPAHQAMLRQVELSVGRSTSRPYMETSPRSTTYQIDRPAPAAIKAVLPLRLCGGKLLVAVTRERRYGPTRLRVNDDDDDDVVDCTTTGSGTWKHCGIASMSGTVLICE